MSSRAAKPKKPLQRRKSAFEVELAARVMQLQHEKAALFEKFKKERLAHIKLAEDAVELSEAGKELIEALQRYEFDLGSNIHRRMDDLGSLSDCLDGIGPEDCSDALD